MMKRDMKKISPIAVAMAAVLASGTAQADTQTFSAKARVTQVEPITQQVAVNEPRQECWDERVQREQRCYYRDVPTTYQNNGYSNNQGYGNDTYTYDDYQQGDTSRSHNTNVGASVAGAVIGGVVGSRFGDGKGKTAATIGGAIIGAMAGNHLSGSASASAGRNSDHSHGHSGHSGQQTQPQREYVCEEGSYDTVRQCRTVNDTRYETRTTGYRVSYRFKGQDYSTTTSQRPGRKIPVTVSVTPDDYNPNAYARVVSATPITRQVRSGQPRQECYDKRVKGEDYCYYRNNGNAGYQSSHSYNQASSHGGSVRADGSVGGTVAGAVVGGVVGAQFGKGKGKTAAAVGGAILGAIAGHEISAHHRSQGQGQAHSGHGNNHGHGQPSRGDYVCEPRYSNVRECRTVNDYQYETVTDGYNVTYKLRGRTFNTRTQTKPGRQLPVRLSVTPRI